MKTRTSTSSWFKRSHELSQAFYWLVDLCSKMSDGRVFVCRKLQQYLNNSDWYFSGPNGNFIRFRWWLRNLSSCYLILTFIGLYSSALRLVKCGWCLRTELSMESLCITDVVFDNPGSAQVVVGAANIAGVWSPSLSNVVNINSVNETACFYLFTRFFFLIQVYSQY